LLHDIEFNFEEIISRFNDMGVDDRRDEPS